MENKKCLKPPTTIIYQVFGGTWNGLGPKLTKQCGFPETTNCPKPLVVARRLVSPKPDDCLRFAEESAEKYPTSSRKQKSSPFLVDFPIGKMQSSTQRPRL